MSSEGENKHLRAPKTAAERLEWQSELDSAMSDLDSLLSHPRRRAGDASPAPELPQLGAVDLTSELLDEIAWRVSQQMRRSPSATLPSETTPSTAAPSAATQDLAAPSTATPSPTMSPAAPVAPLQVPSPASIDAMPEGAAIMIRLRRPLFSWKFWRRQPAQRGLLR